MYNYTLARMNHDRALARREAKDRLENPPPLPYCAECGEIVGNDEPRVFAAITKRRSAKAYHYKCFEQRSEAVK